MCVGRVPRFMNPVNKLVRNMDLPVLSDDFFPSLYNDDRPVDTPFKYSVCNVSDFPNRF